jgi:TonB family protein
MSGKKMGWTAISHGGRWRAPPGSNSGRHVNAIRTVGRILVAFIILSAGSASTADAAARSIVTTYDQALKLLTSGKDNQRAVRLFEEAAMEGYTGALLTLGAIYLEGKQVPQNRPLGFAYLKLAAQSDAPPYQVRDQAEALMLRSQASLSGSELIEADRLAAKMEADSNARLAAELAPAIRVLTTATPTQYDPVIRFASEPVEVRTALAGDSELRYRQGCATQSGVSCPSASRADEVARCTGQIFATATAPSSAPSDGAILVAPDFPLGVLHAGGGGSVKILLHVDRSGWICNAIVAVSSGTRSLDESALATVAKWKLKPATRNGEPVEALHVVAVRFRVVD